MINTYSDFSIAVWESSDFRDHAIFTGRFTTLLKRAPGFNFAEEVDERTRRAVDTVSGVDWIRLPKRLQPLVDWRIVLII